MRAVLIKPASRMIVNLDHVRWDDQAICNALSTPSTEVTHVREYHVGVGVACWVNDGENTEPWWVWQWRHTESRPFVGAGLLLGVDQQGKRIACELTLDAVTARVVWGTKEAA
jgi:hypothetical protein